MRRGKRSSLLRKRFMRDGDRRGSKMENVSIRRINSEVVRGKEKGSGY